MSLCSSLLLLFAGAAWPPLARARVMYGDAIADKHSHAFDSYLFACGDVHNILFAFAYKNKSACPEIQHMPAFRPVCTLMRCIHRLSTCLTVQLLTQCCLYLEPSKCFWQSGGFHPISSHVYIAQTEHQLSKQTACSTAMWRMYATACDDACHARIG